MYSVGDIIYIYKEKNNSLFPCVVAEELVKKTLEGQETSYTVLLPDAEGTLANLSRLNVTTFSSLEEFNEHYLKESKKQAEKAITECSAIAEQKFAKYSKSKKENVVKKQETKKLVVQDENNVKINFDLSKLDEVGI